MADGIQNLFSMYFPDYDVSPAGVELISNLLNGVKERLIALYEDKCKSSKDIPKDFLILAQRAVEEACVGDLKKFALAQAQRQVTLLEMGFLKYDGENYIQQPPTKKRKKAVVPRLLRASPETTAAPIEDPRREGSVQSSTSSCQKMLIGGIETLCATNRRKLEVDKKAKEFLAEQMDKVLCRMSGQAAENAANVGEMRPNHVQDTLNYILGQNMKKAAVSEGARCLLLYENGLIPFQPKAPLKAADPKSSTRSTKSVTVGSKADAKLSGAMFRKGINEIIKSEFAQDFSIEPKARKTIEDILAEVATHVCSHVSARTNIEQIGPEEMNLSVRALFPENEVRNHALSAAEYCVSEYEKGNMEFLKTPIPKKQISKEKVSRKEKASGKKTSSTPVRKKSQKPYKKKTRVESKKIPEVTKKYITRPVKRKIKTSDSSPVAPKKRKVVSRIGLKSKRSSTGRERKQIPKKRILKEKERKKRRIVKDKGPQRKKVPRTKSPVAVNRLSLRKGGPKRDGLGKKPYKSTPPTKKTGMKKQAKQYPNNKTAQKAKPKIDAKGKTTNKGKKKKSSKESEKQPVKKRRIMTPKVKTPGFINFTPFLSEHCSNVFTQMDVTLLPETSNAISTILTDIAMKLVEGSAHEAGSGAETESRQLTAQNVRRATEALLPASLAQLAVAWGDNVVMLTSSK